MFEGADDFTQPLDMWKVSSVRENDCAYLGRGGFVNDMVAVHGRIVKEKAQFWGAETLLHELSVAL